MWCRINPKYHTLLLIIAMMTTGTLNTVSRKISYQMEGKNIEGEQEPYDKAWITTFFMFLGESICLAIFYIKRCLIKQNVSMTSLDMTANEVTEYEQENTTILNDITHISVYTETVEPPQNIQMPVTNLRKPVTGSLPYWKFVFAAACFAILDLVQTTAFNVAMVYIPASAAQILRGFAIVFCLVLAIPLLRRKPKMWEIMGVCFAFLGLVLVGVATTIQEQNLGEYGSAFTTIMGVFLVISGQLFSATQFLMEEKILKSQDIDPLMVVGWEGVCGVILSLCVACPLAHVIPGSDHGSLENYTNSLYMSFVNGNIIAMNILYVLSILFFNWSGLTVGKSLTSTHRSLFDNLRSLLIWVIMIIIYYSTRHYNRPYGEPLTLYSLLELFGFGVMILGVMIHNNVRGFGAKATCKDERKTKYTSLK
ncbi:Integral membrane protein [Giardia lamblia P15]|uniref:Integral membrane protein n=1 Tax=Giardia intestinalis (strain P15) TaxID=658858 RepID=E1F051_GIAIA|nr:Integral membrane protein [Giardia lamblia P15]